MTVNRYDLLVIGGGQAGGNLVLALRRRGYEGAICLVGEESHPPYERPPLSKELLLGTAGPDGAYLASAEDLGRQATLLLSRRAVALDADRRAVTLDDGRVLNAGALVLATGARARPVTLPGAELEGIHYLRTIEDALALRAAFRRDARIVLIGGGTVGLEVASAAVQQGLSATVVESAPRLLPRLLPEQLSDWLATEFTMAGVRLLLGHSLRAFHGAGRVERVELDQGSLLAADLVVCGIGSQPNSELAQTAGLAVEGGVIVDEQCRTSAPGIFAIGDVTCRRDAYDGETRRAECWDNALQQSERLAALLCGEDPGPEKPAWFWTDQLGRNIQILGAIPAGAAAVFRGDPSDGSFSALYHREGQLIGAVGVNSGRDIRALRDILLRNLPIPLAQLADPAVRLDKLTRAGRAKPAEAALGGAP